MPVASVSGLVSCNVKAWDAYTDGAQEHSKVEHSQIVSADSEE